ncbi:Dihydrofolate reductase [Amycolatopsis xylanica]|uniref:Dihydrofolate reductase n=1 Tax=Amycolatopsis xylanica TaxID=589385 RepID=A0A1H2YGP8_9PSEU|nr:dihydrofolate reductase family protein [Amycolatopsis xylanica]SDX03729.1 Dihydrofolate reductase [Amycolatopsis xylanica]
MITAVVSISLDGVIQAPGGADEDTRGGFAHGGWATAYGDEVMAREMGVGRGEPRALLFGRRTYESFYAVWPNQPEPNPFTQVLNKAPKYVASTTLAEPLPWMNSTLIEGYVPEAVARLKAESDMIILGSGALVRSLLPHGLIDQFVLLIHPIVLGSGVRLFAHEGPFGAFELVKSVPTTTGVIIATYRTRANG